MSIGVSKELKEDCKTLIRDGQRHEGLIREPVRADLQWSNSQRTTIGFLTYKGVVEEIETGHYRITAVGRESADELFVPRGFWFRRNWFPATVAAIASVSSIGGIVVNVVFRATG